MNKETPPEENRKFWETNDYEMRGALIIMFLMVIGIMYQGFMYYF